MTATHTVPGGSDRPINPAADKAHAPAQLLQLLAGWLSEAGFADDHPWQVSIAQTRAAHSTQRARLAGAFDGLATDAYDLAAVIRAIGARAVTGHPDHTIETEEHRHEIARALRVAFNLADALGSKAADLAEADHG